MKKLLVLMTALALLAFALPALAQDVQQNDINNNTAPAVGNVQGVNNQQQSQFQNAVGGDYSDAFFNNSTVTVTGNLSNNDVDNSVAPVNKSTITANNNLSGNKTDSSSGTINKSFIGVFDSGNGNVGGNTVVGLNATLDNSLNNNTVYAGLATYAWQFQHQFEYQNDHQMNFPNTFNGSSDATIYMPISNTHMEQANTGIVAGNYAGAVNGANLINVSNSQVSGMFALTTNFGGVGTNQALLNAVTAFSAP